MSRKKCLYILLKIHKYLPEINCTIEYKAIYLNTPKEVTKEHLPSRMTIGTQVISGILEVKNKPEVSYIASAGSKPEVKTNLEVNGAATDASASDKLIPT